MPAVTRRHFLAASAVALAAPGVLTAQESGRPPVVGAGAHRYDRDGRWLSRFGRPGTGPGEFNTPRGLALDDRPGRAPSVFVADRDDKAIAHLGEDAEWRATDTREENALRKDEKGAGRQAGKFLHSHDACFDAEGNIFVAEWVHTGRITKLRKLA